MYVDYLQVRSSEAVIYQLWQGPRKPPRESSLKALLDSKTYSGDIRAGSKKRLRKAVSLLIQSSPRQRIFNTVSNAWQTFSIGFWTLTIADHGADEAKDVYGKCLLPFLKWVKYKGVESYIWKAELQKRGTLHYHIVTNRFVHYQEVQDKWNYLQRKAGYLNKFAKQYGHFRPNSIDVHSMYKVKNAEAYLVKYVSKESAVPISGKVWDCSRNLKNAKYFTTELTPTNLDRMRTYCKAEVKGDYSTIFRLPGIPPGLILDKVQMDEYRKYMLSI